MEHDDAIASDSDDDEDMNTGQAVSVTRRRSSINDNSLMGSKALIGKALLKDKKTLVDISTGKGALGKDATWDDFLMVDLVTPILQRMVKLMVMVQL